MVWFYKIPMCSDDFKDTAADTISFNCGLSDFFANYNCNAAMNAVFVLAIPENYSTVTSRLAVAIEVTEATVAMKAVFLR